MAITLIKNGRIYKDSLEKWVPADILIKSGTITAIEENIPVKKSYSLFNAKGNLIVPAFADLRTHLYLPPYIRTEDLSTTLQAARAGGYGVLLAAPTTPALLVRTEQIRQALKESEQESGKLFFTASVSDTSGRPSDLKALFEAGAFAAAEEGYSDAVTLHRAMQICAEQNKLMIVRPKSREFVKDNLSLADYRSSRISPLAEDFAAVKAIALAADTGCHLHLTAVSSKGTIEAIRAAKKQGISLTCDVCPPYFTLTGSDILFYGNHVKLDPPLRREEDRQAILSALADGTIDAISSDHTAVEKWEKEKSFESARCGMLSLQTAFSVSLTALVKTGFIPLTRLLELMALSPLKIMGLPYTLSEGSQTALTVCDVNTEETFQKKDLIHRSGVENSPYPGQVLTGKILFTST
jgi:dihydroorotase